MFQRSQQPDYYGSVKTSHTLKKPALIGLIVAGVLLVLFVGYVIWQKNYIALTTFKGFGIEIQVPKPYEQVGENGALSFMEPGATGISRAYVTATSEKFAKTLTSEQFAQTKNLYNEDFMKQYIENFAPDHATLSGLTIATSEQDSAVAYNGRADVQENNKTVGTLTFRYTLTPSGGRMVVVYAHKGDGALQRKAQTIIDSLRD